VLSESTVMMKGVRKNDLYVLQGVVLSGLASTIE